jgi:diguanylate cyclase (GGDEF)-like protein
MMIDIDFFKKYNDSYGHSQGDVCLRSVAGALSSSVTRADDFVARYGGEEFAVVMPNTDEAGALLLADKMLNAVRACNIPHEMNEAADCVTISIGVTSGVVANSLSGLDFIKRADDALYLSKQSGRNKYTYVSLDKF